MVDEAHEGSQDASGGGSDSLGTSGCQQWWVRLMGQERWDGALPRSCGFYFVESMMAPVVNLESSDTKLLCPLTASRRGLDVLHKSSSPQGGGPTATHPHFWGALIFPRVGKSNAHRFWSWGDVSGPCSAAPETRELLVALGTHQRVHHTFSSDLPCLPPALLFPGGWPKVALKQQLLKFPNFNYLGRNAVGCWFALIYYLSLKKVPGQTKDEDKDKTGPIHSVAFFFYLYFRNF